MEKHMIYGIHISDRMKKAGEVQSLFTKYGCNIKTRIGLHDASDNVCAPNGVVLLEMVGDERVCNEMADALNRIEGIEVQKMIFK
ncbi:MAG: hypothetical protein JXA24_00065 [Proteobacteria bacterium]|nr:hypothetical protein [Pseudomonadota bacterium]